MENFWQGDSVTVIGFHLPTGGGGVTSSGQRDSNPVPLQIDPLVVDNKHVSDNHRLIR